MSHTLHVSFCRNSHCLEPSQWFMAKRKGLQGRPLAMAVSSQQGMPVPSAHHSVAKTMAPPAQADGEVQSSVAWKENIRAVPMTTTPQLKQHLILFTR